MSTTTRMRLQRAVTISIGVAAALVVPLAPPASADPQTKLALLAYARLWAPTRTATYAELCAEGHVDDGTPVIGEWVFRVVGPTSTFVDPRAGAAYSKTCHDLTTAGVAAGTADASIAYVGVNGDVLAECTVTVSWAPSVPLTFIGACAAAPPPVPLP